MAQSEDDKTGLIPHLTRALIALKKKKHDHSLIKYKEKLIISIFTTLRESKNAIFLGKSYTFLGVQGLSITNLDPENVWAISHNIFESLKLKYIILRIILEIFSHK